LTRRDKLLQVFHQDVVDDHADYLQLDTLMQRLYGELLRRDCPCIDQSNALIDEHLQRLAARAGRRSKVLAAFGLAADEPGIARLLRQYPPAQAAPLRAAWQALGQLAARCKVLNSRNGQLLAQHHDLLSQLLAARQVDPLYQPQHY
jgi:flagella synthesis protein FlgN